MGSHTYFTYTAAYTHSRYCYLYCVCRDEFMLCKPGFYGIVAASFAGLCVAMRYFILTIAMYEKYLAIGKPFHYHSSFLIVMFISHNANKLVD